MPDTSCAASPTLTADRLPPLLTCTACALYKHRSRICGGVGPVPSRLMFVGEAPGPEEDRAGAPFIGEAGGVFDSILRDCEIDRSTVVVSNVVRCFPGRDATGQIEKPTKESIAACRTHLETEVRLADPVVLVALGATAFKALTGSRVSITKARGVPVEVVIGGKTRTVVPTFHPSYAMRSGGASSERASQIVGDVRHALAILNPKKVEVSYRLVRTMADFEEFKAESAKWDRFAFDIETRGLDLFDAPILGIGFSAGERTAWYVPLTVFTTLPDDIPMDEIGQIVEQLQRKMGVGSALEDIHSRLLTVCDPLRSAVSVADRLSEVREFLGKHFGDYVTADTPEKQMAVLREVAVDRFEQKYGQFRPYWGSLGSGDWRVQPAQVVEYLSNLFSNDARKTAHNGKFDVQRLKTQLGIEVCNWVFDTLLAAYALDENAKTLRLSDLVAQRYPDLIGYKTDLRALMDQDDNAFAKQPVEKIGAMCMADCDGTFRLSAEFHDRMTDEGLSDYFDRFLMPTARCLAQMEIDGIAVDLDYASELATEVRTEMASLLSGVRQRSNLPDLNPNSNLQLAKLFFTDRRYPVVKRTEKGGVSVDASVLETLATEHGDDIAVDVVRIREKGKILGTYLDPLPTLVHPKTGRVHTDYFQTRTVSGRLSSANPNMQNIPDRTELGHRVRGCFVPSPGGSLICCDYSQMELRILAAVSGDPTLIAACSANEDLHTAMARPVFGIPPDQPVLKEKRNTAKAVQFAVLYGAGPDRVAAMTGVSVGEADAIIRKWFATFPRVAVWIQGVHRDIYEQGYAINIYGGRRRAYELRGKKTEQMDYRDQEMLRSIVNSMIQGPASMYCCAAMVKLRNRLTVRLSPDGTPIYSQAKIVLQVHDAVYVDCPDEELETVVPLMRETLLEPVAPVTIPMAVELKVVKRWSDA